MSRPFTNNEPEDFLRGLSTRVNRLERQRSGTPKAVTQAVTDIHSARLASTLPVETPAVLVGGEEPPTSLVEGTIWRDTSLQPPIDRILTPDGWEKIEDPALLEAIAPYDSSVEILNDPTMPTGDQYLYGSLWRDPASGILYRWDGTQWRDTTIGDLGPLTVVQDWIADSGAELEANLTQAQADLDAAEANIAEAQNVLDAAFPNGAINVEGALAGTITGSVVEYAVNSSETVPPTSGWSTDSPTRNPGTFVWYRTIVTYGDGTTAASSPALLTGNTGAPGVGEPGVGIESTEIRYQVGSSGTSAPTGSWVTTVPATTPGTFLWTRTLTTFTDDSTTTAYSVAAHGTPGADGDDGNDGVGISGTAITYQVGSSGTVTPTGSWVTAVPATTTGEFLWTRTVTTYTDASTSTAYSVAAHGTPGADGVGISETAITYQIGSSGTAAPGGAWVTTVPATTTGEFLWTRTVTTFSDASTSTAYSVAAHGTPGADGDDGNDGVGVSDTEVRYLTGSSATTAPTGTWSTTPTATTTGQFLWTRTITTYTDASTSTAYSVAAHGTPGADGDDGVGISDTEVRYQIGTSGTTAPTGTWLTTVPATTTGTFLWTRTLTTFTDGGTSTAYAVAAHGTPGADGDDGNDGVGVSGTEVTYQTGTSGTSAPTGAWSSDPTATSPGQFLWTRTIITYTNATTSTAYSVAKHGSTGSPGDPGEPGVGVSGTEVRYQVGTSGTSEPTGSWLTTIPATTPGTFLWTRTVTSYTNSTSSTAYSVAAHGTPGADGDDGNDGVGVSGTEVRYQTGTSATTAPTGAWSTTPTATTTGQFLWTRTIITYTDASTSTAYSVAAHGAEGEDGADGVGVSDTEVEYQVGTSGTAAPGGAWSTTVPATAAGQFLWTRTITTYTDASTSTAYSVAAHGTPGADGDDGNDGVGVSETEVRYQVGSSATSAPTGTWSTTPTATTTGKYQWTRTVTTYTDGSTSTAYSVAAHGTPGADGNDGVGVSGTEVKYQVGSSGTTEPTGTWLTTVPATATGQFLWTRTVTTYTDASTSTAYSVSAHGTPGADGDDGNDGVGVQGTAVTYQVSSSGTSTPTGSWVTAVPGTSPGQYLWTRTIITYTDTTTTTMYSVAKHGTTGNPGVSITAVVPYFRHGTSTPAVPTTNPPPSPWTTTEPSWVEGQALYRTELIVYSAGSPGFAYTPVSKVAAYTAADAAMVAANGKNTMTYSNILEANKPGPAPTSTTGRITGDVHRNRNATTGEIYAEWMIGTSGTWQPINFGDQILTSLDVGKITGGSAAFDTFVANSIVGRVATLIELDVARLRSTELATLNEAVVNKLWTDVVRSRKITTDMLIVGSGENLLSNPDFVPGEGQTATSAWGWPDLAFLYYSDGQGVNGSKALVIEPGGPTSHGAYFGASDHTRAPRVEPGGVYRLSAYVRGHYSIPIGLARIYVSWRTNTGAQISLSSVGNPEVIPLNTVERFSGQVTAPANAAYAVVGMYRTAAFASSIYFSQPKIVSATDASLLVDGTIQGRHVDAESVAAEIGEFVEVKAANILAGDINVALNLGVNGQIQIGSDTEVHIIAANNEIAAYEADTTEGGTQRPGKKFISLGGINTTDEPGPVVSAYNVDNGTAMGGLRQDGSIFATRVDADEIMLDGQELMPLVRAGFVTRGYGSSEALHTGLTTKTGVFAVFCPGLFRKDFQYRVTIHWLMRVEGSAWCDVTVRERSDSLPPSITLGSQIHQHTYPMTQGVGSAGLFEGREVNFIWRPTSIDRNDVTFLLCLQPVGSGAIVAARRYEMTVTEEGPALPDTGYDNYVAPPLKKYTQTFDLTPHYPFSQYGAVSNPYTPHRVKSGQGGSSIYRTFLPMPLAARNVFSAANSVDKVEIFLKQSDGYYNVAPRIGTTTATSYSASTTIANEVTAPKSFSPGDGEWFTVPPAIAAALAAGARTFVVGSRSSGYLFQDFYGPGDSASARPKIRITSWR